MLSRPMNKKMKRITRVFFLSTVAFIFSLPASAMDDDAKVILGGILGAVINEIAQSNEQQQQHEHIQQHMLRCFFVSRDIYVVLHAFMLVCVGLCWCMCVIC